MDPVRNSHGLSPEVAVCIQDMFRQWREQRDVRHAMDYTNAFLASYGTSSGILSEYGRLLLECGHVGASIPVFRRVVELRPHEMLPHLLLAHALLVWKDGLARSTANFFAEKDLWQDRLDDSFLCESFHMAKDLQEAGCYAEAIALSDLARVVFRPMNDLYHTMLMVRVQSMVALGQDEEAAPIMLDWYGGSNNITVWRGEDVSDKTLLVIADLGQGDRMMFVRYLPDLAKRCGRLVLKLNPSLRTLFGEIPGVEIVENFSGQYDYLSSLFMLPYVLGINKEVLDQQIPYFHIAPDLVAKWQARLPQNGFKIGIVWEGSGLDKERCIPLRCFAPLSMLPGVKLISLQVRDGLDQLHDLPDGMVIQTLGDEFDTGPDAFVDTAAVMLNLDLVLTADTATGPLAGALGRPVWTLLKSVSEWRWKVDREDTIWYPSIRLMRQRNKGDWDELMGRVVQDVAKLMNAATP